jgi:hypothetical protein
MAPFQVRDQGVVLHGFKELNRALTRIAAKGEFGLEYELQRRLRIIGEKIAADAPNYITHNWGPGTGDLGRSMKVSVTTKSAAVYSTSDYGGVQNSGGGPHAGWAARGPHVRADKASHWMNKAVAANKDLVAEEMDGVLDWLLAEFERG